VKKSQFVDSHYNEFWSNAASGVRKSTRTNSAGPFGARVEHDDKQYIDGFMNCLRWYIEARTKNDDTTNIQGGYQTVAYIIYGEVPLRSW
jgi:hypothetical protein